jgi:hypothetical protein
VQDRREWAAVLHDLAQGICRSWAGGLGQDAPLEVGVNEFF